MAVNKNTICKQSKQRVSAGSLRDYVNKIFSVYVLFTRFVYT